MSDGPHKSLPMRRQWKNLAERAGNSLYTSDEVEEAFSLSLKGESREAPISEVRAILGYGTQRTLFDDDCSVQLDAVRQVCRGSALGDMLIDCAIEANANGLTGDEAVHQALRNALEARAWSGCRQIEEHQYRELPRDGAMVRDRLNQARNGFNFDALASELMSDPKSNQNLRLTKHTGIDEGPPL